MQSLHHGGAHSAPVTPLSPHCTVNYFWSFHHCLQLAYSKLFLCLLQTLKGGVMSGADSAAGWKALAELQYQNR